MVNKENKGDAGVISSLTDTATAAVHVFDQTNGVLNRFEETNNFPEKVTSDEHRRNMQANSLSAMTVGAANHR